MTLVNVHSQYREWRAVGVDITPGPDGEPATSVEPGEWYRSVDEAHADALEMLGYRPPYDRIDIESRTTSHGNRQTTPFNHNQESADA